MIACIPPCNSNGWLIDRGQVLGGKKVWELYPKPHLLTSDAQCRTNLLLPTRCPLSSPLLHQVFMSESPFTSGTSEYSLKKSAVPIRVPPCSRCPCQSAPVHQVYFLDCPLYQLSPSKCPSPNVRHPFQFFIF